MPASAIAQILLRLFALQWILTSFAQIGSAVFLSESSPLEAYFILPASIYFVAGIIVWFLAPFLCRLLTTGIDQKVTLDGVTLRQLYATTFIGLGTYFVLNSFANVFSWVHFFIVNKSPEYGFYKESSPSYYDLTEGILTLLAGAALIGTARVWAKKLTHSKGRSESEPGLGEDAPSP